MNLNMKIPSAAMKNLIIFVLTFLSSILLFAQDYYWVGGTGNWSDYANHWATTSGGSTFHTQAPTTTDNVIFDANSFNASSQVVTLDAYAYCNDMNWTGVTNFPTIIGNSNDLFVYGSLALAADMTADFTNVRFPATTTGHTITSVGTTFGSSCNMTFEGIGGEWSLMDNLSVNRIFMRGGTFNTNNHEVDVGNRFEIQLDNVKVLNLGSSTITTGTWDTSGSNTTINAGTSTIKVKNFFFGDLNGSGPYTYYNLEFDDTNDSFHLDYSSNFNSITVPAGSDLELRSGDTFTVANGFIANGTKHNPINIFTSTDGSEATINQSAGAVAISYANLTDVHASGGATFTANNSTGNGNTTGWTINAPVSQDYYWVGNGGNWTDFANHWATTSGGGAFHTDYPSRFDNVFFDANSFTVADETVTIDLDADCNNMDWTGVTNSPILSQAFGLRLNIYGSATFTNEVDKRVYSVDLEGSGTHTVTYGDNGDFTILAIFGSGDFTFQDSVFVGLDLQLWDGTLNLNGNPLNTNRDISLIDGTLNAGTSNIYCDDFDFSNSSSTPTFNEGTSSVYVSEKIDIASTTNRSFSFYNLILDGTVEVEGAHTIENLTIEEGSSVSFEESTTTTVTSDLFLNGTKASPISIGSTLAGTQATLSKASGTVNATYLILQDIAATGGATYNATETIDNGNNTGWIITGLTGDDYYWVGDGGNWSDFANHWATTSGGSTFHVTSPGVLDNVFFDANSFSVDSEVVTIDVAEANCNDIDASTTDQFFFLDGPGKEINIYGSASFSGNINHGIDVYNFLSGDVETIDFQSGPGTQEDIYFLSTGTWTLASPLVADEIHIEGGTLNTNDQAMTVDFFFQFEGTDPKTLNLGATVLNVGSFRDDGSENVTINGGTSEIIVTGALVLNSSVTHSINLNNVTYPTAAGSSSINSSISVNRFTIEPGVTVNHSSNPTITANEFVLVGTEMDPIIFETLVSSTLTMSQPSGIVDAHFLQLQNVVATGGATFNAYDSEDNGGVIGWVFHRASQTITFGALSDKTFGDANFDLTATASSGLTVSYEIVSGPATIDGNTVTLTGAGTVEIKAEQSGNVDYDPAPSVIQSFEVMKGTQVLTFDVLADKTFGDPDFSLMASSSSGLSVDYSSSNLSVATIENGVVSIVGSGSTTITASQSGNDDYNAAVNVEQTLTVVKADQTISFGALENKAYGDEPFNLTATGGNSTQPVLFESSNTDVVTILGSEVTIVGAGEAVITASQLGDANYEAATDVEQMLVVNKAVQTISFDAIADFELGVSTSPIILNASATSGLAIAYQVVGPATLSGDELTPTAVGEVTVTASQVGDTNFESATDVSVSFEVTESVLSIDSEAPIQIFPNPTTDYLEIKKPTDLSSFQVLIYTLKGEKVFHQNGTDWIDLRKIEKGVYLLKLLDDTKVLYRTKLVIAR